MRIFNTLMFISMLILTSCGNGNQPKEDLLHFDMNGDYPLRKIVLQDYFDINYVPLETNETFLVNTNFNISKEHILSFAANGDVHIFDRKTGKGILHFNKKGPGNEDYVHAHTNLIDDDRKEILIFDGAKNEVFVYDFKGEFLRKFHNKGYLEQVTAHTEDGNLIWLDAYPYREAEIDTSTYYVVSPIDGKVIHKLPLPLVKFRPPAFVIPTWGTIVPRATLNAYTPHGRLLKRFSDDTIYIYRPNGELEPMAVSTPSVHETNPPKIFMPLADIDNAFFARVLTVSEVNGKPSTDYEDFVYDKQEKKWYRAIYYNRDLSDEFYVGVLALGDNYSEDIGAKLYDATFLIEYREKGVFTGRLNEIASQLKEDDNPVIMTISYKK